MEINLPNNWQPRPYQQKLWNYLESGGRRGLAVCHRRWGKDDLALHWTAVAAHQRIGSYWHMLPEYSQARKAIWAEVNPITGIRRIDEAFPPAIRETTNEQGMFIRFKNGSTWTVIGSDNYNSLVGAAPVGLVFSEWAIADPATWPYLSPILEQNGGWALFIYTSRGKNHGHKFYELSQASDDWCGIRQTADQTGVFTQGQLKSILAELIALYGEEDGQSLFDQEYFCSFDAAIIGAYYGRTISQMERDGRIMAVPYDPNFPVHTAWDLGLDDSTAIWFAQIVGREVRVIDYYEARNRSLLDTGKELLKKPYAYIEHYCPHDIDTRELTTAHTRKQALESIGIRPIRAGSQLPVTDGINAVRNLLSRCVFDAKKCEKGIEALRAYRTEWVAKDKTSRKQPKHDWSSHGADAFRELGVQLFDHDEWKKRAYARTATQDYNPFSVGQPQYEREVDEAEERARMRRQETSGHYDPFGVR